MHIFVRLQSFCILQNLYQSFIYHPTPPSPSAAPAHMSPGMSKYGLLYADFHETNAPHHVNKSYNEFQLKWTISVAGMHTNSYVSKGILWLLHSWFSWNSKMLNGIKSTSSMPYFIQVGRKVENVQKCPCARK
jgi:hypothetical protein